MKGSCHIISDVLPIVGTRHKGAKHFIQGGPSPEETKEIRLTQNDPVTSNGNRAEQTMKKSNIVLEAFPSVWDRQLASKHLEMFLIIILKPYYTMHTMIMNKMCSELLKSVLYYLRGFSTLPKP